jgi:hypothetical protein
MQSPEEAFFAERDRSYYSRLVEGEIAHHHLAETAEVGIEARWGTRRRSATGSQQACIMCRLHHDAVACGLGMTCDQTRAMEDLVVLGTLLHADGLANVRDRH